ncbi:protease IV (PspA) [hydrothermal vent metagenome]|uniref:Protease IV (PspA) n=1 Tax=hydrothermal vent metagenome TaxID=652676 RepID=A0A1W1C9E0_9ZZZZ
MFKAISNTIQWIGRHFMGMLFLLIVVVVFSPKEKSLDPANLQEIKLSGAIMDSDTIIKEIEKAQKNDKIKGVLLTVNSPGGAVAPSIEISYAIRELKAKKPVIAYASGIMASGSYYSSIYANKIIANPGAIIGSIGVIMESANLKELMDKIGVKPQIVQQGRYKQAGTPTRQWTPEERAELEQLTADTYKLFVSDVAKARGLDINNSKAYADAHIFAAQRAKSVGLVDSIGTKSSAKKELQELAKVDKPVWKKRDKIEAFVEKLTTQSMSALGSYLYGLKASL